VDIIEVVVEIISDSMYVWCKLEVALEKLNVDVVEKRGH
jgi:hypothetical protein